MQQRYIKSIWLVLLLGLFLIIDTSVLYAQALNGMCDSGRCVPWSGEQQCSSDLECKENGGTAMPLSTPAPKCHCVISVISTNPSVGSTQCSFSTNRDEEGKCPERPIEVIPCVNRIGDICVAYAIIDCSGQSQGQAQECVEGLNVTVDRVLPQLLEPEVKKDDRPFTAPLVGGDGPGSGAISRPEDWHSNPALRMCGNIPAIKMPQDQTDVIPGSLAVFDVDVITQCSSVSYQWLFAPEGSTTYTAIVGARDATLLINNASTNHQGNYVAEIKGEDGKIFYTTTARLRLKQWSVVGQPLGRNLVTSTDPVITVQPQSIFCAVGAKLKSGAAGTGLLALQWERSSDNGETFTALSGATLAEYTVQRCDGTSAGMYRLTARGDKGIAYSEPARVVIRPTGGFRITTQPLPQVISTTAPLTLSVVATAGVGTMSYQWQRKLAEASLFTDIPGATAATYVKNAPNNNDAGVYRVLVYDDLQQVPLVSNEVRVQSGTAASLSVPQFTRQVVSRSAVAGGSVTLSAAVRGATSYQWFFNDIAISGATTLQLVRTVSATTVGAYQLEAINNTGRVRSDVAYIGMQSAPSYALSLNGALLPIEISPTAHYTISDTALAISNYSDQGLGVDASVSSGFILEGGVSSFTAGVNPLSKIELRIRVAPSGAAGVREGVLRLTINSDQIISIPIRGTAMISPPPSPTPTGAAL